MMEISRIISYGKVIDNDDLLRLGRLRIVPLNQNQQEITKSAIESCRIVDTQGTLYDDIKDSCKWTENDPFLVLPLLPYSLNITPKKDELVIILYPTVQNAESTSTIFSDNFKYYIPITPTTPLRLVYENFQNGKESTPLGYNIRKNKNLKEFGGNIPPSSFGIFPEPEDNALLGRGSTDVILKENELILRAGKTLSLVQDNLSLPVAFDNRAFMQLSLFKSTTSNLPNETTQKVSLDYKNINYIIEWDIENPENEQDVFRTKIRLYEINSNDDKINSKNLNVDTDIKDIISNSVIAKQINIENQSFESTVDKINDFIKSWNDATINYGSKSNFPFAYRPSARTYQKMLNTDSNNPITELVESVNISRFYNRVCLNSGVNKFGFGIVFTKDNQSPPTVFKTEEVQPKINTTTPQTFGTIGADKIFLLSHKTQTTKGLINLSNTIYGLDQNTFENVESKTEPMVRGEALMDLLNLICKFLIAHVHPFHGMAPVPTALDGTLSSDILQKILNSNQTILNHNIRIN